MSRPPSFVDGKLGIDSREEELWGVAHALLKLHGQGALQFADAKACAFAHANEMDAADMWTEIFRRIVALMRQAGATLQ